MSEDPRILRTVLEWIGDTTRRWTITFAGVDEHALYAL